MENKKPDRRVLKTKRAIRNAFAELLIQKDINEITVKDIADLADINRKTFYNYYSGVYQVMDEIENEIISACEADLNAFDICDPNVMFGTLCKMIDSDIDFYGKLIQAGGNSHLMDKIITVLQEKTIFNLTAKYRGDPKTIRVIANFTVAGIANAYQCWFLSNRSMPIEKLFIIINNMVASSIKCYLPLQE